MLRHGMRNSFCPTWVTRLRSRRSRGEPQGGRLVFAYGTATVVPGSERLTLRAAADDTESLAQVQDVVSRHLERFGARRAVVVEWRTDSVG
jgi:uncharacterized protein